MEVETGGYTVENILCDPYGFTYKEMELVMGVQRAKELFSKLYKGPPKKEYQTLSVKAVYKGGDTQKYAYELADGKCIETVYIKRISNAGTGELLVLVRKSAVPSGAYFVRLAAMDLYEILLRLKSCSKSFALIGKSIALFLWVWGSRCSITIMSFKQSTYCATETG